MKQIFSVLFAAPIFAFAQETVSVPQGSPYQTLMMIGLAVVFFYFILFRPEQKRKKAAEQMRASLKKGDRVTAMGILGTIVKVDDQTVVLRMVDGAKIEMLKAAITDVQPGVSSEASETSSS